MGTRHEYRYSADVEAYFIAAGKRFNKDKTNDSAISLAEPRELPPSIEGELLVIIDGDASSRRVLLPECVERGQTTVKHAVAVPF